MISADTTTPEWTTPADEVVLDLDALVKANLQPLPGSASRILGLLQINEVSTHEISDAIGFDPILASRVMRLANSPFYALLRPVSTVSSAVSAVGLRSVYDIVMVSVAADSFSNDFRSIKTGVSIWEHSVAVALASRGLSQELGLRGTEEAFTCGLLHDIGKNLLFLADRNRFSEIEFAEDEDAASKMEKKAFGFNHSEVGAAVCNRWGLSDAVSSTIFAHHDPKMAVEAFVVAHIVNVADELVTMKGIGLHMEQPGALPQSESARLLRLENLQMEMVWESVEEGLHEILAAFK